MLGHSVSSKMIADLVSSPLRKSFCIKAAMAGVQPAGLALLGLVPEAGILYSGGVFGEGQEGQEGGATGRFRSTWRSRGEGWRRPGRLYIVLL